MAYLVKQRWTIKIIAGTPVVAASLFWAATVYPYYLTYSPEQISQKKYSSDVFVNNARIARYIRERTSSSDYIFQWGFEPELYFLADRRSPNLYTVHFAVAAARDPWYATMDLDRSIRTKLPVYIIIQLGREKYPGYKELSEILLSLYTRETDFGGSQLWRIR
jgi:hypothetical protein